MKTSFKRVFAAIIAVSSVASLEAAHAADKMYFRLRPSVSILNQDPFSVRIDGDRAGVVGSRYGAKAEASSPRETLRFSVTDGALPPGVSIDPSSGSIQGFPMARGRFAATVTAEDAFSTASAPLNVTVYDALEIESTVSQFATVGQAYSATFKGLGGDQSYRWTIDGTTPTGLTFGGLASPTSSLSGVPTVAGNWSGMRVNVADGANHTASSSLFSIAVADVLTIAGSPSAVATVGESYSATFTSNGGHAPIDWTKNSVALPAGLSFSNGSISGTPTAAGTASGIVISVTDRATNRADSSPFSIAVSQPLSLSGNPALFATVGQAYSAPFTASGGNGSNTWSVRSGPVPDGIALGNNGSLAGTPSLAGTWPGIVIGVQDGNGRTAQSGSFTLVVSNVLEIAGTPAAIGTVGQAYAASFAAEGGDGNYTFAIAAGALPTGVTLAPNGAISGAPTVAGPFAGIVVRVTDGNGRVAQSQPFAITVSNVLSVSGSAPATTILNTAYTATYTATGGNGAYTWASVGGALPPGLSVPATGGVTGAPYQSGTYSNLILRVTDGNGRTAQTQPFTITVLDPISAVYGSAPTIGTVGTAYSATFSASGGGGSLTWDIVGGTLPSGLAISNGQIYGTPTQAQTASNLTVRVRDSYGQVAYSSPFSITVYSALSLVVSNVPWQGTVGVGYGGYTATSGGSGSYVRYTSVGSPLPDGLYLSGGTIVGTPSRTATYTNLIIEVQDSHGRVARTAPFSIAIYTQVYISGAIARDGWVNEYFQSGTNAYGGRPPYTWAHIGGTLPYGTYHNGAGVIYGTPYYAGGFGYVLRVTDADGRYADAYFETYITQRIIREPAGGDIYDGYNYVWTDMGGGLVTVNWGGGNVGWYGAGTTAFNYGGATYYRGDYRTSMYGKIVALTPWGAQSYSYMHMYGLYRTIP
jgi:hypothetical protein